LGLNGVCKLPTSTRLKTFLFTESYIENLTFCLYTLSIVDLAVFEKYLGQFQKINDWLID